MRLVILGLTTHYRIHHGTDENTREASISTSCPGDICVKVIVKLEVEINL